VNLTPEWAGVNLTPEWQCVLEWTDLGHRVINGSGPGNGMCTGHWNGLKWTGANHGLE